MLMKQIYIFCRAFNYRSRISWLKIIRQWLLTKFLNKFIKNIISIMQVQFDNSFLRYLIFVGILYNSWKRASEKFFVKSSKLKIKIKDKFKNFRN